MIKLKFNKSPIFNLICVILLFDSELFNNLGIPVLGSKKVAFVIEILLSFALLINCFINSNVSKTIRPQMTYYYFYFLIWILFIIIVSIFSLLKYNESLYDMFTCTKYYYPLLLFPPLLYVFKSQDDYKGILNFLLAITVLVICLRLFNAGAYNFLGKNIFHNIPYSFRSGRMRIGMTTAVGIAFVFSVCQLTNSKKLLQKALFLIIVCVILFYTFYTNMTRMYIIAIVVSLAVTVIFKKRTLNNQILLLIAVAVVVSVGLVSGTINNFIDSFSSESNVDTALSTVIRQNALEYFRGIVNSNPLFGMGFVSPKNLELSMIYFGPDSTACFDDLGLINMWYHYGVFGVIIVSTLFLRWIHLSLRLLISKSFEQKQFIFGIIAYNVCIVPSLSIFDGQRIIMVPIIWALLEYFNYKNKSEREELIQKIKDKQKIRFHLVNNKNHQGKEVNE